LLQLKTLTTDKMIDELGKKLKHVQFLGLDKDAQWVSYGASIPFEKAFSQFGDVIIAYSMNGQDIPRDHGYPLRIKRLHLKNWEWM